MDFKTTLSKVLELKQITPYRIGKDTSVSKQSVMNYMSGKSIPSGDALKELADYLNVTTDYLIGNSSSNDVDSSMSFMEKNNAFPSKPHVDSTYADCGKPGGFSLCVKKEECEMISLPFLKDYDFSITASGQSMINRTDTSRSIRSGDIVACKLVKSRTHVRFGEVYALSTVDGFTIKKVVESNMEGCIRCESFNVEDGFTPFDIPTNEIFDWAFVIGVASINKW
ncbi:MAG: LexA family transcriptional regulator [Paludibacter sp.]|nr:LexA family transcriptional regulator [Paludibacter sp.]